jgi:TPR repeat protein
MAAVIALTDATVRADPSLRVPSPPPVSGDHEAVISEYFSALGKEDYATTLQISKRLADQGDADGEDWLADAYRSGNGVPKNATEAARLYRTAAMGGDSTAAESLGELYEKGEGVPKDERAAARWYLVAAAQLDFEAYYQLGRMYEDGRGVPKDWGKAVIYLKASIPVESGTAADIGMLYHYGGPGLAKDFPASLKWLRAGANAGDPTSKFFLAYMYEEGEGTAVDYAEAMKRYAEVAGEEGVNPLLEGWAQQRIGRLYEFGKGVDRDPIEAARWYRKGAEHGDGGAQGLLAKDYWFGTGVPQDYSEAVRLARRAADQGDSLGQLLLGNAYAAGTGLPRNLTLAHMWFNLSSAAADTPEQAQLAARLRDQTAAQMTPAQVAEAQRLAHEWKPASTDHP